MSKPWYGQYPSDVSAEIEIDTNSTLVDRLQRALTDFADRDALSSFGRKMTFGELDRLSARFAGFLVRDLGVKAGDRIAIMMPNLLQYPVALIGALRAGAVVVNVNPLYTPRELEHQITDSGSTVLVVFEAALASYEAIEGGAGIEHVIASAPTDLIPGAPSFAGKDGVHAFASAVSEQTPPLERSVERRSSDMALLQYTGGTTGVSKGAVLTHANVVANLDQFLAMAGSVLRSRPQVMITALPLYHIFAFTVNLVTYLTLGGINVLIANPRDMPGFVEELKKWRFTSFSGVNTLFNGLLHTPGFDELDFSGLHFTVGGGMAVQRPIAERWKEVTGCHVLEGYGLSETAPVLTMNPTNIDHFTGKIGLPLPSTDISIRDPDGKPLPVGEAGELCAKGPQVMPGYWQNDEATAAVMTEDGYFRTGDVATMDERGYFAIVDRKKDMILVSGFNVYPNEVEAVVASHPAVIEAACIGVPDERTGEAVKLFVVVKPGEQVSLEQVREHCASGLAPYKLPTQIEFIDEVPKSAVGKILRRELRK